MDPQIQDLLSRIMAPQRPAFLGVQTQQDPNQLQALLQKLQEQQAISQAGAPSGGEYGFLRDAGRQSFAQVGQGLGGAISGAINPPDPNAPPSPQAQQAQAQDKIKQAYNAMIAQGMPELQARALAQRAMVAAGLPGAGDALNATGKEQDESTFKAAETKKNNAQADMDTANISNQSREKLQNTWATVGGNAEYILQKNGLGEVRSVKQSDKASLPPTAAESADMDSNAQKVANYQMSITDFLARKSGAERQAALQAIYNHNPDYNAGNYAGSQAAYRAFTSGKLGDQARFATNVAAHSLALEQASDKLNKGDLQGANAIAQEIGRQTGDPNITSYDVLKDIVAKEGVKALVPNAGSAKERANAEAEYAAKLSGPQLKANTTQLRSAVGVQYNNLKNQYEKTTFRKNFSDIYKWPGADSTGNAPEPTAAPTAPAAGAGWGTATIVGK